MNTATLKQAIADLQTVVPVAAQLAAAPETALEYRALMADMIQVTDDLLLAVHGTTPAEAAPSPNPHRKNATTLVKEVGDFFVWPDKTNITIFLPRDDSPITLPLGSPHWILSGTDDFPTLSPSIFRDPPRGYHGYLQNGVLTQDLNAPAPAPEKTIPAIPDTPARAPEGTPARLPDLITPPPLFPPRRIGGSFF